MKTRRAAAYADLGLATSVPLLGVLVLVCLAEFAAGRLLWQGRRAGTVLALALLPVEMAFWIGFALPLGPPLGLARTALALVARRAADS